MRTDAAAPSPHGAPPEQETVARTRTDDSAPPAAARVFARYGPQLLLGEIGLSGQAEIMAARVLVVGMGGVGHPVVQYLAAAGVGCLGLIDDDVVEYGNLQRQVLFADADVGRAKVDVVAEHVARANPDVAVVRHHMRLTADNVAEIVGRYDVVADGTDDFAVRLLVNDACAECRTVLVSGAVGRFDGQVATFKPWLRTEGGERLPCYRSLVPDVPATARECAAGGVVGALAGVVGSLVALEIVKEITGAGESLAGRVLVYDALAATIRTIRLPRDPVTDAPHTPAPSPERREVGGVSYGDEGGDAVRDRTDPGR